MLLAEGVVQRAMSAPLLPVSVRGRLLAGQDLKEFEKKITEFTLPNGLHFILLERHEAPVVSFHTFVNAGSARRPVQADRSGPNDGAHGL